jgi:hypothetical protein
MKKNVCLKELIINRILQKAGEGKALPPTRGVALVYARFDVA